MNIHTACFSNLRKFLHNCASSYQVARNYSSSMKKAESMSEKDLTRELRKIRREKRLKSKKTEPSTVTLQILGSGVPGSPSSLYVSTDHSKYLFNCGEGTQRLAHEHHLRLAKLEHVFFTTATWKNMGGLPGMALTIQDGGIPEIKLHGPKGIAELFEPVKRFAYLENLTVTEATCDEETVYQDNCMSIRYVPLVKSTADTDSESDEVLVMDETDYYAHEVNKNGKRGAGQKNARKDKYARVERKVINFNKIRGSTAFICKLMPKPGRLSIEQCVEKGVPPGPLLGELKNGKDIVLPDGTLVKAVDVTEPSIPGPVFIVLECPNEDYLDSVINNDVFREYQAESGTKDNHAAAVIHFTPENILNTDKYKQWMQRFPDSTEHMIINEANRSYGYEALHRMQHKLNLVHPTIFPLVKDLGDERVADNETKETGETNKLRIHRAKTLNAIHLRPFDGIDKTIEVKIDRKTYVDEAFQIDGFLDALAELQTDINAKTKTLDLTEEYPKVLVLGTGSCIPSKVRNTSGLLVRIDPETSFLLDCGEGTAGQIIRFFGPEEYPKILKSIKGIFVSHLHADHHLGLINIFQERQRLTKDPVFLFGPKRIHLWLKLYNQKFETITDAFNLIPSEHILAYSPNVSADIMNEVSKTLKIQKINTVEVIHCAHSFGVAFTLDNGKKIVYSGDTKPCPFLVDIGQNCDLLIHEATMEDGMEKEASLKMHSTVSQALDIGKQMGSKFVLLTHFSQRYSKIPRLPDSSTSDLDMNNVGIAFDNMYFSFSELPLLPLFYPTMKTLFSEFVLELEEKAMRRNRKANETNTG